MICKQCGNEVNEGLQFCNQCGCFMESVESKKEVTIFCKQCGNPLKEGAQFCNQCGYQLGTAVTNREKKGNLTKNLGMKPGWKKRGIPVLLVFCVVLVVCLAIVIAGSGKKKQLYAFKNIALPLYMNGAVHPTGHYWEFSKRDNRGKIVQGIDKTSVDIIQYDDKGNVILCHEMGERNTREFEYDSKGNLEKVVTYNYHGEVQRIAQYSYDTKRNVVIETGSTEYGAMSNWTTEYWYDVKEKRWNYRGADGLVAYEGEIDKEGTWLKRVLYDYSNGIYDVSSWEEWDYTYDKNGNLVQVTIYNAQGVYSETEYTYNDKNMLETIEYSDEDKNTWETEYKYDKNKNVKKIVTKGDNGEKYEMVYTYEYDSQGRVIRAEELDEDDNLVFGHTIEYDRAGGIFKLEREHVSKDWDEAFEWDAEGRIAAVHLDHRFDNYDYKSSYEYDTWGNLVKSVVVRENNLGTDDYNQKITTTEWDYEYDRQGNFLKTEKKEVVDTTDSYGDSTRKKTEWETEYEYDKKGNLLSKVEYEEEEKIATYEYDTEGRLLKLRTDDFNLQYEFDENGNIVKFENDTLEYEYEYDKQGRLVKKEAEQKNSSEEEKEQPSTYEFVYDKKGNLTETYALNKKGEYMYYQKWNSQGQLLETFNYNVKDYGNATTSFEYDEKGYPDKMTKRDEDGNRIKGD